MSEFRNGDGVPIVALDIDGTMGDYHSWFLWFAGLYLNKPMPDPKDINPGLPLHKHMGVTKAVYREVKLAYRQSGLKRAMPVYPAAADLTRTCHRNGAHVWICTTRPYLRLDNIDPDTREWLRRNKIEYDAVLFGDNKYQELVRQVGPRVAAVVEDLPEMVEIALERGVQRVYIRDQPYNQHYDGPAIRLHNLVEAHFYLLEDIKAWKVRNGA